jgi:hypothetical protein
MKSLEGAWYTLDSIILRNNYNSIAAVAIEAPLSRNANEKIEDYILRLVKGVNGMEVIKIENGIATISNGVKTRIIKIDPSEYLKEIQIEIDKTKSELERLEQIKEIIYKDQILITKFLLEQKGE